MCKRNIKIKTGKIRLCRLYNGQLMDIGFTDKIGLKYKDFGQWLCSRVHKDKYPIRVGFEPLDQPFDQCARE